jgi:ATP-binding cassette, subfamily B (MDR/TAP), member 1
MTAIPHKSSKSFESSIDSWFPMPTSENSHEGSPYELQTLDRNGPVNKVKFSWRSLFVFTTRKHTLTIIVALISTIASSLLKPAAAIFFGNIFSSMTRYGAGTISIQVAVQQISKWCVALTALGVAAWLAEGVFLLSWMIFGELQAKSMREQIFTGMLDKNMEWYDLRNDGIGTLLIRIQT